MADRSPAQQRAEEIRLATVQKDAVSEALMMYFEVLAGERGAFTAAFLSSPRPVSDAKRARIAATLPAAFFASNPQRQRIYDTGASTCCIGIEHLNKQERSRMYTAPSPLPVQTAGGEVMATSVVDIWVPFLG